MENENGNSQKIRSQEKARSQEKSSGQEEASSQEKGSGQEKARSQESWQGYSGRLVFPCKGRKTYALGDFWSNFHSNPHMMRGDSGFLR